MEKTAYKIHLSHNLEEFRPNRSGRYGSRRTESREEDLLRKFTTYTKFMDNKRRKSTIEPKKHDAKINDLSWIEQLTTTRTNFTITAKNKTQHPFELPNTSISSSFTRYMKCHPKIALITGNSATLTFPTKKAKIAISNLNPTKRKLIDYKNLLVNRDGLTTTKGLKKVSFLGLYNKYPFQSLVEVLRERKIHGVFIENINNSFEEHRPSPSSENYENGMHKILPVRKTLENRRTISEMYKTNNLIFHRQKKIAEYCDLSHLFAKNEDKQFSEFYQRDNNAFIRCNGKESMFLKVK